MGSNNLYVWDVQSEKLQQAFKPSGFRCGNGSLCVNNKGTLVGWRESTLIQVLNTRTAEMIWTVSGKLDDCVIEPPSKMSGNSLFFSANYNVLYVVFHCTLL